MSALTALERPFAEALRYATDDELRTKQAECQFHLDMAVYAEIHHTTDHLEAIAAELVAATYLLHQRAQRGFEVIDRERGEFDRTLLDEIKARFDLATEIGRTVDLFKAGRNWRASCPYHQPDRTPSFIIYTEDNHFHCYGCGVHGDIFDWLEHVEGVKFPQAVRLAAERAGVMLPYSAKESHRVPQKTLAPYDEFGRLCEVEVLSDVS